MAEQQNTEGRVLTAADILRGGPGSFQTVEVPELDGVVYLRPVPAGVVLDYLDAVEDKAQKNKALVKLIAASCVNPDGSPMFSADQADELREMSSRVFTRLAKAVMASANANEMEEAGGNG